MNKNNDTTYLELPFRSDLQASCLDQAAKLSKFKTLAIIGIGGSSVGPETFYKILEVSGNRKKLVFFDNTDFLDAQRKVNDLSLQDTAWFIASKSGTTLETLATTEWISQKYRKEQIDFYSRCVVCTEVKSNPLSEWATQNNIPQLEIPVATGGRFSVLSPIGLFPLAFAGINISDMVFGAKEALEKKPEIQALAEKCAQSFGQHSITVFWFYSSVAKPLGAWIQQLWAESLAKKLDRNGKTAPDASTPFFAVGASDQHSILQQVSDGKRDKFVLFFRSHELENYGQTFECKEFPSLQYLDGKKYGKLIAAAAEATQAALNKEGVLTDRVFYPDHSAHSMGYMIMWFELLVAAVADKMNINAFDQPGVELGKILTKEILQGKS